MKKILSFILCASLSLTMGFTALAAGVSTKPAPTVSSVVNSGADITVSWNSVDWPGADKYEVQLGRTNETGTSFLSGKSATVNASENSHDFTVSQKGYYTARVRARDVEGKNTAWSGNGSVVVVASEDVRGTQPFFRSPGGSKGPGVPVSESNNSSSASVSGGPGQKNTANGNTTAYSSSSSTNTRKRVLVNTYAQNGWQTDRKGRWYLFSDGTYPVSCWERVDGKFYHFDSEGYMEWNRWVKEQNGSWRFCIASGEMATGWNNISEKWYYMEPSSGEMLGAGEHIIDGKVYYMNAGGDRVNSEWVGGHYYGSNGARE